MSDSMKEAMKRIGSLIAEYEARIAELEARSAKKDDRIAELEAERDELHARLVDAEGSYDDGYDDGAQTLPPPWHLRDDDGKVWRAVDRQPIRLMLTGETIVRDGLSCTLVPVEDTDE